MLSDVMKHFQLVKEFRNVGYFETAHHKEIFQELKTAIRQGKLIAVSGIVGSGKTTTLRKIRDTLDKEKEIIVAKAISIEKTRVTLNTLLVALFYDLSTEKELKIPTQAEKRERKLQELIKKRKMPVALFIDEAHDLHGNTLIGLKRLIEMVQDCGGTMSVVLAGHPKLKNDLHRASLEEIGSRTTVFNLDGIAASKREFIEWLLRECTKPDTDIDSIITEEAIDLLADRLLTPLQIEHHLALAFEAAYMSGESPVTETVVESILAKDIDGLEQKLTRHGYNVKTLAMTVNVLQRLFVLFYAGNYPQDKARKFKRKCWLPGSLCEKKKVGKTLFSINVGPMSLLRAHYHLMWVHYRLMWVRPVSYSHLLWAQINHYCGSGGISLRVATPTSERKARLRVGLKDVDRETFANAVTGRLGKQRVSIMLDSAVVEFFKAKAGERGYQTLINQALHQVMHCEQLETALRRVIREELSHQIFCSLHQRQTK